MKKDLISVVIPCYNVEDFLDDCFNSLKAQTYKNFEMIFVDDGSKDKTLDKLRNYEKEDERVKVVAQRNQGVSMARNSGIAVAEGEFLAFIDPDDMYGPQILEVLYNMITKYQSHLSICQRIFVKENYKFEKIKMQKIKSSERQINVSGGVLYQKFLSKKLGYGVLNKLYSHSILQKIEGYPNVFNPNSRYGEDIEMNVKYFNLIENAVYLNQNFYYHRKRKGSLVKSKFSENKLTIFYGPELAEKIWKEKYPATQTNAKSCKAIFCLEMLFRISRSGYENSQKIQEIYDYFKNNAKFVRKCKENNIFQRLFVPMLAPLTKCIIRKKLKNKRAN